MHRHSTCVHPHILVDGGEERKASRSVRVYVLSKGWIAKGYTQERCEMVFYRN